MSLAPRLPASHKRHATILEIKGHGFTIEYIVNSFKIIEYNCKLIYSLLGKKYSCFKSFPYMNWNLHYKTASASKLPDHHLHTSWIWSFHSHLNNEMLLSKLHVTIVLIILHNVWSSRAVTAAKGLGALQLSWDLSPIPTSLRKWQPLPLAVASSIGTNTGNISQQDDFFLTLY